MASRTSVTSENITEAPARTSRSAAKPSAGLAVTPENASAAPVEHGKARVRHFHDGLDNGAETVEGFILHPHDMAVGAIRQKPLGNEFLAAEADDHDFAAEIRIHREVLQGSDRDDRQRR